MKKHLFLRSSCSLLIGLVGALAPLSSVQAGDAHEAIQKYLGDGGAGTPMWATRSSRMGSDSRNWQTQEGAQGPMRSDTLDDRTFEQQRMEQQRLDQEQFERQRSDTQRERTQDSYPLNSP